MSKDILKIWRSNGFRLTLYYTGGEKLVYRFSDKGVKIFEGDDFRPSPIHAIDSLETVYGLLGFLSLCPGDTDSNYFKNYSPEQVAWCDSGRAEYLSLLVNDFENRKVKNAR